MNISVDFGETITSNKGVSERIIFPDALRVIRRMVDEGHNVFIVSKVNEEQKIRVKNWIVDNNFIHKTGISLKNIFFCTEWHEKASICKSLGIEIHIDDRPQVMICLEDKIKKYLFRPVPSDVVQFFNLLKNTEIMMHWFEIEKAIFFT